MTKERRLAIEMWKDMRELVSQGRIKDGWKMLEAKLTWLEERGINWYHECWFCTYFRKDIEDKEDCFDEEEEEEEEDCFDAEEEAITSMTPKCPLNRYHPFRCGGRCKQYAIACTPKCTMEQRLEAVDNIIKALKGEYKE